ncbi:sulfite exporter TauE/SafE family protein [Sphingobium terrigena]|uniref:Probable membrane transporter protein n=1 Tax=Sphingobium terrigena TaxID=2304063 RepID=A0A418YV47_9SPHN|nr:sulfite exporter TauE/SafE family protein [Sphingobium terrigena]RJG56121.1 sulfite exporter TauE/SafE family protein [Sphingobium terrigena]
MILHPLYSLAGFVVGILVGLTGVGGGSLMTPILVLLFNFHPVAAVGTDLLYACVTKGVGSLVHGIKGSVDWRIVGWLALGSLPAATASLALLAAAGPPTAAVVGPIKVTLGVMLLLTGIVLLGKDRIFRWSRAHGQGRSPGLTRNLTIALGMAIGAAVTVTSVGAGAIGATALLILYPRIPLARIVGTDVAHAVPLTLLAGVGHWWLGTVDFTLLGSLLFGSVPGIIIGSLLASHVRESVLRPILACILIFVAGNLIL